MITYYHGLKKIMVSIPVKKEFDFKALMKNHFADLKFVKVSSISVPKSWCSFKISIDFEDQRDLKNALRYFFIEYRIIYY